MSELTFEQMLEESFKTIRNGEVVDGTVIDVKPDEIILNIGYKADGIIMRNEYTNEPNVDLTTLVSVCLLYTSCGKQIIYFAGASFKPYDKSPANKKRQQNK